MHDDEDFEKLTDVELHYKLLQYGFPNIPVTETSRSVLVKKLKNHVKNAQHRNKWLSSKSWTQYCKCGRKNHYEESSKDSRFNECHASSSNPVTTMSSSKNIIRPRHNQSAPSIGRMYAPPIILASETEEDSEYECYTTVRSTTSLLRRSSKRGIRLASQFRDLRDSVIALKRYFTPYTVRWLFAISLIVLTCNFMFRLPDLSEIISVVRTHFIICSKPDDKCTDVAIQPPYTCIEDERLPAALELIRQIMQLLLERAEVHFCTDSNQPVDLSVAAFQQHLHEQGSVVDLANLEAAQYLITCNPQWKIAMVDKKGSPVVFNGVDRLVSNQGIHFALSQPYLPPICALFYKLQCFFQLIGISTVLASIMLIGYIWHRFYTIKQRTRVTATDRFIKDIVAELKYRATYSDYEEERLVIVNHLRDQLIPSHRRDELLSPWDEALRLLESNDSRIQFGVATCNCEQFRTMKWTGDTTNFEYGTDE